MNDSPAATQAGGAPADKAVLGVARWARNLAIGLVSTVLLAAILVARSFWGAGNSSLAIEYVGFVVVMVVATWLHLAARAAHRKQQQLADWAAQQPAAPEAAAPAETTAPTQTGSVPGAQTMPPDR